MKKFIDFLEKHMMPFANKISKQRHLMSIRNTFITLLPILFFGGIIAVINASPVTDTTTNGFLLAWAAFDTKNAIILSWLNTVTLGFLALYVCIGITYYLSKHYEMDMFIPVIISVSGFTMLAIDPQEISYGNVLGQLTYLDGKGLLVAIFVAIFTVEMYRLMRVKNLGRIKMPEGVPPALSDCFSALIPALMILAIFGILFTIFHSNGTTLAAWIIAVLAPGIKATDTLGFAIFVAFMLNFAWFFGIHDAVFSGILAPIEYGNLSLNAAALAAGTALPQVFTVAFWCYFGIIGGLGNCLSLAILCVFSKSQEIKAVGRLGFVPALFGVSEPITFGLPIMLNPLMFFPSILTSMLNVTLAYTLMSGGVIGRTYAQLSYNMPSVLGAYFSTGDFKAILLILVLIVLDLLIYFPFFKAYERQAVREEKNLTSVQ